MTMLPERFTMFNNLLRRKRLRTAIYFGICAAVLLLFAQTGQAAVDSGPAAEPQKYVVLCYHSIPARFNGDGGANSVAAFTMHLAWLRENGYTPITVDDVLQAKAGRKRLPNRAYLLTVDDGYEDFYVNVFPILKAYKIPAVLAVVGRWIENGPDPEESSIDPYYAKQQFVTWAQVKEMSDSGLVEIASHSYDLHHGVMANPQNNQQPAAVTLRYDAKENSYETPEHRRLRVRSDLQYNSLLIRQHTGKAPRVMVWPYGEMDQIGSEEAKRAGMPVSLTLIDGFATVDNTDAIPRTLIQRELRLSDFSYQVSHKETLKERDPVRVIRLSLDRIYDPDPQRQEEKFGRLLDQTLRLGVNTVLLQPFAMPAPEKSSAAGAPAEAYFPNSLMPMRTDLLNRVAWQMHSRLNVDVFMLIDPAMLAGRGYSRADILAVYRDLSLHVPVQGMLFEGGPVDFDLLANMNYLPRPKIYIAAGRTGAPNAGGTLAVHASDRLIEGMVVAPPRAEPARLDAFVRALPADRINIMALPLKDANGDAYRKMRADVRFFQYRGISDFLVDGDDFLDDPAKADMVRQAVSMKANPFAAPGQ
ncbi:poly-beta-1,6-N-acetyl-D-glucosamine N-deacetylase PgaB [Oxalobacteraceae bacterium CAVE-383]|nr:poly-beta-1,6-N-acetyl-D-glucosamine N-deacetylase PgaB [Oxalobacteraceae bacterium CAVE-383]